jgi:hypothetical protein
LYAALIDSKYAHLDELGALDEDNIILADRRTRGKRVDYTEGGLAGDNGSKSGEEIPKEKKGAPAAPRTISPERKPVNIQEEDEEEEEEEEYEGDGGDEDEDGTDSYDEDEDE